MPWSHVCALLQAAAWLGHVPLVTACETNLITKVSLENVIALARAAERCNALRLLSASFFLLKAFFCAESDEARPRRHGRGPLPKLTKSGIRQGTLTMPPNAWRDVIRDWQLKGATLRAAQPCYTLCSLIRQRGNHAPYFKLISEHDNKLLLVARQRWPGEGDFFIFSPPVDVEMEEFEKEIEKEAAEAEAAAKGLAAARMAAKEAAKAAKEAARAAAAANAEDPLTAGDDEAAAEAESAAAEEEAAAAAEEEEAEVQQRKEEASRRQGRAALRRQLAADAFCEMIARCMPDALPDDGPCYRGCLAAKWMGLGFSLYDGGLRPGSLARAFPFPPREELASITYASNLLKSRPHQISIVLRDTDAEGVPNEPQSFIDGESGALHQIEGQRQMRRQRGGGGRRGGGW